MNKKRFLRVLAMMLVFELVTTSIPVNVLNVYAAPSQLEEYEGNISDNVAGISENEEETDSQNNYEEESDEYREEVLKEEIKVGVGKDDSEAGTERIKGSSEAEDGSEDETEFYEETSDELQMSVNRSNSEPVESGTCGENVTWELFLMEDDTYELIIAGEGDMYNFGNGSPWKSKANNIQNIIIKSGITGIGDSAFLDCTSLENIELSDTIISIENKAFANCTSLKKIYIPCGVETINASTYEDSPFYNCSSSLAIYCEVDEKPLGWGTYWRVYWHEKIKCSPCQGHF